MKQLRKERPLFTKAIGIPPKAHLLVWMETIHIPLWLFKDICWLMEFRTLGVIMAIPTILVAIFMVMATRKDAQRFLPNVAVLCWIIANTNWMLDEFFNWGVKMYSLIPFLAGVFVFLIFVLSKLMKRVK